MTPETVEEVARAMALNAGECWDAKDFTETMVGNSPDEAREYWRDAAQAAIFRLETLGWKPVPEGWKLVPVEPTPEMLRAATMQIPTWGDEASRRKYAAMLSALPTSPTEEKTDK